MEKLILKSMIVPKASLMKKALHFFLLILIGSLAACSSHYIGKRVPWMYSSRIENSSGSDTLNLKEVEIDFNYYIDRTSNTITLEGTVKILPPAEYGRGWDVTDFIMDVFFLDSNNIIVDVKNLNLHIMGLKEMFEPMHFKRTFPYDPIYAGIAFKCRVKLVFT